LLGWIELHCLAELLGVALEPPENINEIFDVNL